MTARTISTLLLGIACLASIGCDEKLSTVAGPTPNLEPTFASIQSDIFQASDNGSHTFTVTMGTTGSHTVTGTDTVTASITGTTTLNTL